MALGAGNGFLQFPALSSEKNSDPQTLSMESTAENKYQWKTAKKTASNFWFVPFGMCL